VDRGWRRRPPLRGRKCAEAERENKRERERGKEGRLPFCLRRAAVARLSFSFFSARARGDFSIFPAPPPSRVPTFRRGFSGISLRGRKQKGRRSVKSNSANVQPRRRFTLFAEGELFRVVEEELAAYPRYAAARFPARRDLEKATLCGIAALMSQTT